ncbi:hypothetical protein SNE40_017415 [Patella caerulea]|uniref:Uncharacterized protein n=1 Tax=Patella caerulea TaxID=87958 RepID=A0AAN8JC28_PATCE
MNLYNSFHKQISQCENQLNSLDKSFGDLKGLVSIDTRKNRNKRSLLPLGGILSSLFGTADSEVVNKVKDQVNVLQRSQKRVIHVLQEGLSVLNTTNRNVQINRGAINALINSTENLGLKISYVMTNINQQLKPEIGYFELVNLFNGIFDVFTFTLHKLSLDIREFHSQIVNSLDGKLSVSLVPVETLYRTLLNLQSKLPTGLELHYPIIKSKLAIYYEILQTTLVPDVSSFNIIVPISLIQKNNLYDIYKLVHLPMLNNDGTKTINYEFDQSYFAISQNRNSYIHLSEIEVNLCHNNNMIFCTFHKPAMSTNSSPSCMSALFLKDVQNIVKLCHTAITLLPPYPISKFLTNGNWYVFTPFNMNMDVICLAPVPASIPKLISLVKGENIVTLPPRCSATSKYFSLLYYIRKETSYEIRHVPSDK